MCNRAVLILKDGVVDALSIPSGMEIIVRDYDCQTIDPEVLCIDKDGGRYIEIIYEAYEE